MALSKEEEEAKIAKILSIFEEVIAHDRFMAFSGYTQFEFFVVAGFIPVNTDGDRALYSYWTKINYWGTGTPDTPFWGEAFDNPSWGEAFDNEEDFLDCIKFDFLSGCVSDELTAFRAKVSYELSKKHDRDYFFYRAEDFERQLKASLTRQETIKQVYLEAASQLDSERNEVARLHKALLDHKNVLNSIMGTPLLPEEAVIKTHWDGCWKAHNQCAQDMLISAYAKLGEVYSNYLRQKDRIAILEADLYCLRSENMENNDDSF